MKKTSAKELADDVKCVHIPRIGTAEPAYAHKKDVKDVISEFVMKRRVGIKNLNFQNFDWRYDISEKSRNGHFVQNAQEQQTTGITRQKLVERKQEKNETSCHGNKTR